MWVIRIKNMFLHILFIFITLYYIVFIYQVTAAAFFLVVMNYTDIFQATFKLKFS